MMHAAGVVDEAGRVVALVGPSGRGKTTAARTLAARYGYVSDETIGIDAQGNVLPYRKPLSIIEDGLWKTQRPPSELGLRPLPDARLKVAAVGGVRRVSYREAATLRTALEPLFRDPAVPQPPIAVDPSRRHGDESGICRGPYLDALPLDAPDRLALIQPEPDGTTMFRLIDGIGPALWRAATGVPFEELVGAAEAAHGRPDRVDIVTAVRSAVSLPDPASRTDQPAGLENTTMSPALGAAPAYANRLTSSQSPGARVCSIEPLGT